MRKFIKSISIGTAGLLLITSLLALAGFNRVRSRFNFRIRPEQHIVVFGSSLGECCINDSILPGWRNLCRSGDFYVNTVPILKNVLAANPQIDTVFIAAGIPSFASFSDSEFYNADIQRLRSWGDRIAISEKPELEFYFSNPNFIPYLFTSGIYHLLKSPSLGHFLYLKRHALQYGDRGGMAQYEQSVTERGGRHYSYEILKENHHVQIVNFERMIAICKKHQVACVIFNTPLYHIERYYENKGYKDYLATLDDSLLIADYNSFAFPDTSYYGDVHHLNHLGAAYFCKQLKNNGIKTQYLIDYIRQ